MSEVSRLRWRCRRGTKELDFLLERFVSRRYEALDEDGRRAFEQLLDQEDDALADWLLTGASEPTDGSLRDIVRRVRDGV
ncbi:succinate dehydrogenase assembly factor 2 [Arhodomonas aquaeolei]|uniref:FAD assembly factor SdhE n=1 Tax=Arhodomonas TaxID=2368 RepID=UPI0013D124B7|nr:MULTISPECIES: succinate dehydrogenase assembly factor 2 [Arhodomonas]MCS4503608.1 succinate dehydrogenase assembly factor 2 [Arhodomonas aquaeolei]